MNIGKDTSSNLRFMNYEVIIFINFYELISLIELYKINTIWPLTTFHQSPKKFFEKLFQLKSDFRKAITRKQTSRFQRHIPLISKYEGVRASL